MGPVVADAGPPHYLILIDAIDVLPRLFGRVLIPDIVAVELSQAATPLAVRTWMQSAPPWLERRLMPEPFGVSTQRGAGERAAIELAQSVGAQLLLIDDRAGDLAARACGLETTGTVGVLLRAAPLGFVDLATAFSHLRSTNFRYRPELLDALLAQNKAKDSQS
jgi:predicted nucleic acid-binding protein